MSDVINLHPDLEYWEKATLIIQRAIQSLDDLGIDPDDLCTKGIVIGKLSEALRESLEAAS